VSADAPVWEAIDWPLPRKHLSASAISTFATCPEQFRRGYVCDDWRPSAPPLLIGAAMHGGLEYALMTKMRTGELPPIAESVGALHFRFDREVADNRVSWYGKKPDDVRSQAERLFRHYAQVVLPELRPVAVEHQFELRVAGVPVPIRGKIDVLDERWKVEVKTGGQTAKVVKPQWKLQGLVYLLVDDRPVHWHSVAELKGGPLVRRPGDLDPKTGEPETDLELARTPTTYSQANAMVRSVVRSIRATYAEFGPDQPWPGALAHQWACNLCEFQQTDCAYWTPGPGIDLLELA
jgi:hypothetical protein